jgi:glycosyltransferase involved in cell wall biosynthesis
MGKKILFVAPQPFFEIRGTPIANKNMLEILSSKYKVDFLSYPIGKELEIKNVTFHKGSSFGIKKIGIGFSIKKIILDLGLYLKMKSLLKKNKYQVIHSNEESIYWSSKFAKKYSTKFVYDMDSIMSEQLINNKKNILGKMMKKIEFSAIKQSDLILGISNNFKEFCKLAKTNLNYVTIWDVPQIEKKEKLEKRFLTKLDSNKKKILYFGNNEEYQGVANLLSLSKEMKEFQFILAGVGKDSIENNLVKFSKVPMEQIPALMDKADLLISPRRNGTNTPMKIYTYMSSGKPIVASDIPAHNILEDCGIIVDQEISNYKKGIFKALSKEGKELGMKAKRKVEKQYGFEKLKKLVLKEYRKLE